MNFSIQSNPNAVGTTYRLIDMQLVHQLSSYVLRQRLAGNDTPDMVMGFDARTKACFNQALSDLARNSLPLEQPRDVDARLLDEKKLPPLEIT